LLLHTVGDKPTFIHRLEAIMKPIVGAAALGALALGGVIVLATSRPSSNAQAYQMGRPVVETTPAPEPIPVTSPVPQAVRNDVSIGANTNHRAVPTPAPRVVTHTRSTKGSVAIIGGSTVGGAVVGGLIGGKKGAVIGGLVGGGAGTVYDHKTKKKTTVE
jgi:hypothetical protein